MSRLPVHFVGVQKVGNFLRFAFAFQAAVGNRIGETLVLAAFEAHPDFLTTSLKRTRMMLILLLLFFGTDAAVGIDNAGTDDLQVVMLSS